MVNINNVIAPAKINLYLHVGELRSTGLHEIDSLMVFATENVADRLSFEMGEETTLEIGGEFRTNLGSIKDNLVVRAINYVQKIKTPYQNYHIKLDKFIPVGAGLGGGSADAGAALRYLADIEKISDERCLDVAKSLGSDVPACFKNKPCVVRGQGEDIRVLSHLPKLYAVLVNCRAVCSTSLVFQKFKENRTSKRRSYKKIPDKFSDAASFVNWLAESTSNDLEDAAMSTVAEIGIVVEKLKRLEGVDLVRLTGSGATCFALCESEQIARNVSASLAIEYPEWWIKITQIGGLL